MLRLKEYYQKEIIPKMIEIFGYKNKLALPRLEKVVLNVGIGKIKDDSKSKEIVSQSLAAISGQKALWRRARRAISGFKLKRDEEVGLMVTLRGQRMYDFLEKLIRVVLPRTKDFRGIKPTALDQNGNLNLGFSEQVVFPEIKAERVEKIHPLEVSVVTTAKTREEAREFFSLLGFIFREESKLRK